MKENEQIHEKWAELIGYAQEHATGKGLHTGYRWLQVTAWVVSQAACTTVRCLPKRYS